MEMTLDQQAMKEAKEIWEKDLESNFKAYVNNCFMEALRNLQTNLEDLNLSIKNKNQEGKLKSHKNPFSFVKQDTNYELTQQTQNINDSQLKKNPFSLVKNPQESQQNQNQQSQNNDDILRKNFINIYDVNIPSLKLLTIPELGNPLINLFLYCSVNFRPLIFFYFKQQNEERILRSPNILGPAILKLFDHYWKSPSKEYSTSFIHNVLHKLLKNDYFSLNPGLIFKQIISQLRYEISVPIIKEYYIDNDSYNFNKTWLNFSNLYGQDKNMILYTSYSIIKGIKLCQRCNLSQFFFETNPIINIYLQPNLNMGSNNIVSMMNSIDSLLIKDNKRTVYEYCNNCNSQSNKFISKGIIVATNFIIFNINRDNDPYKKVMFNYPIEFYYNNIIDKNHYLPIQNIKYDLIAVLRKIQINNNEQFIVHIKNFVNSKWYAYNNKEIIEENGFIMDNLNTCLFVYQKNDNYN